MSDRKKRKFGDVLFSAGLLVLLLIATLYTGSILYFSLSDVERASKLGSWGDFVGGTLNPILTFLTFVGLLATIFLQRRELSLTRDEMARSANALEAQGTAIGKQNFERTFFEMLNLHNSIVNSIDLVSSSGDVTKGRDCFRVFYTRFTKIYREERDKGRQSYTVRQTLELSWNLFWKEYQLELGHYFRFLYNFLRFLDTNENKADYHVKLLRSQLSDQELLIIFYNCTQDVGQKFRALAEKYEIFDNMPTVRLLEPSHADFIERSAFGKNAMLSGPDMRRKADANKEV